MPNKIRYEDIEALVLKNVPEIKKAYYDFGWEPIPYPTDEWLEELHHIPLKDVRRLGATIVFESILVPFVMSLFEDETSHRKRIQEIINWVENLAHHEDLRIRETLVGVCVCEQILDKYGEKLPQIYPYFGPRTKEICWDHAKRLNVEEHLLQYLAE